MWFDPARMISTIPNRPRPSRSSASRTGGAIEADVFATAGVGFGTATTLPVGRRRSITLNVAAPPTAWGRSTPTRTSVPRVGPTHTDGRRRAPTRTEASDSADAPMTVMPRSPPIRESSNAARPTNQRRTSDGPATDQRRANEEPRHGPKTGHGTRAFPIGEVGDRPATETRSPGPPGSGRWSRWIRHQYERRELSAMLEWKKFSRVTASKTGRPVLARTRFPYAPSSVHS